MENLELVDFDFDFYNYGTDSGEYIFNRNLLYYLANGPGDSIIYRHPMFTNITSDGKIYSIIDKTHWDGGLLLKTGPTLETQAVYIKRGYTYLTLKGLRFVYDFNFGRVDDSLVFMISESLRFARITMIENGLIDIDGFESTLDKYSSTDVTRVIDENILGLSLSVALFLDFLKNNEIYNRACCTINEFVVGTGLYKETMPEDPIRWDIIDCSKRLIVVPVRIQLPNNRGHSNVIIIDKETSIVDYYEPHGSTGRYNKIVQDAFMYFLSKILPGVRFTFNNPLFSCPLFTKGLVMQGRVKGYTGGGLCQTWVMYYITLVLINPTLSSDILQIYLTKMSDDNVTTKLVQYTNYVADIYNPVSQVLRESIKNRKIIDVFYKMIKNKHPAYILRISSAIHSGMRRNNDGMYAIVALIDFDIDIDTTNSNTLEYLKLLENNGGKLGLIESIDTFLSLKPDTQLIQKRISQIHIY